MDPLVVLAAPCCLLAAHRAAPAFTFQVELALLSARAAQTHLPGTSRPTTVRRVVWARSSLPTIHFHNWGGGGGARQLVGTLQQRGGGGGRYWNRGAWDPIVEQCSWAALCSVGLWVAESSADVLLVFNQLLLNGLQGQGLGSAHIGSTDKTLTLLTSSESLHCYLCTILHWHIALLDQQHCFGGSFLCCWWRCGNCWNGCFCGESVNWLEHLWYIWQIPLSYCTATLMVVW